MATSVVLGLGLVLQAAPALGQNSPPFTGYTPTLSSSPNPPQATQTLQFTRDPQVKDGKDGPGKDMVPATKGGGFENLEFRNLKEVPGPEVLFRLESESALRQRMKQEALRAGGERILFPDEPPITKESYPGRHWVSLTKEVEPYFVVSDRLLFEQKNTTRGIWDFGPLTPAVCLGKFYWDALLMPYNVGTRVCQQYDTDAGKCLPGDPSPLFLYPVELSLTGLLAEGAAVTGAFFIFP
jgi:hypothetical protein